jgi:LacI family transcriptional regulator
LANIKDIAKLLGVSVSTVSRAMNNHPDVREETKLQIMEAVRLFNYRPNALAKGLIQKKTFTVGLLVPDIADPFPSSISNAVEETLFEQGYQVIFGNGNRNSDKEKQFLLSAIERQFDGLILTPDYLDDEFIEMLSNLEIPVVFLRRRPPEGLSIPFVDVDHYQAATVAMNYLIEMGHRQIGFIGMHQSSFIGSERMRGYTEAMRKNGLLTEAGNMILGGRTIENGREAMGKLLENNPDLTAVFAANDLLGIGGLEWLALHQIPVPEKLSVIGFDNLEYAGLYWIQLTTMEQPRKEMGRRAAQLLLQMISDKGLIPESELMEAKLVIRRTVK